MGQTVAEVYAVNYETLREELPTLYEMEEKNLFFSRIQKADSTRITKTPNGTDFRVPLEVQPPSDYGLFNVDGGTLGTGNASINQQLYQTALAHSIAIDLNYGAIKATEAKGKSTVNTLENNLRKGMQSFKRMQDVEFFSQGSGAQGLLALSTGFSGGVVTCDPEWGASLLQVGLPVEIFSNDLVTRRTAAAGGNLPKVLSIAPDRTSFTLGNLGAIVPQATDYYALRGVGDIPAAMNGELYFHNTATSGNILGLSRTTYPELIVNSVDASGALTPTHFLLLSTKIYNRFNAVPPEVLGCINPAQAMQIYQVGIAISEWMRGSKDEMIDIIPKSNNTTIVIGGTTHLKSAHQSKKRVDWFNMTNWGRVYIQDLDFYTDPDGKQRWFEGRNAAGAVTANWKVFMVDWSNVYCADPGKEGVVLNASIPPGA